jgi:hypothetical protein
MMSDPTRPRHGDLYNIDLPDQVKAGVSTSRLIVGIAGTAMQQLDMLKNGVHPGFVVYDLYAPIVRSNGR